MYDYLYDYEDNGVEEKFVTDKMYNHPNYDDDVLSYDVCILKQESGGLLRKGAHACLPQSGKEVCNI